MIRTEAVYKSFDSLDVLKDINVTFAAGQTNLVIGRSGSGKTVLLKIIVGLLEPTKGKIWYDTIDFLSLDKRQMREVRMKIGMLFQGSALFDSMTVEQNIRFPMDMFTHATKKEKTNRINYCLERVELEGINNKFPSEISGGMQKRVGIARAIVLNPKYLLCDEPNSGLDPKTAILIDGLISSITKEFNMTTVINTHDMNSVMQIGEYIVLLHQGYVAWTGTKDEVFSSTNQVLYDFVFASPFLQKVRDLHFEGEG
ncbi:MAG TPA: ATP-binding cassette domain-containing protein [Saprospiraceae bacterium]|nr:ATP-binding cassette domain-containing protein [Saprospiraceae bacterium]